MDTYREVRPQVPSGAQTAPQLPRILIVWNWVPCFETGAGIILRRLFGGYPLEKLWLLTSTVAARHARPFDPIPESNHQIKAPQAFLPRRFAGPFVSLVNLLLIPLIAWRGVKLVREKSIEALFSAPWNTFFISIYLIHKITRCPLHIYVMDDPVGSKARRLFRAPLYNLLMPRILRSAETVWGVCDYMCADLQERYGVNCQPLLPPLDVEDFHRECRQQAKQLDHHVRIAYTGAIYSAQLNAIQNLVRALNRDDLRSSCKDWAFSLMLFTSVTETTLKRMSLIGPAVRCSHVKVSEIARVLAESDILFLPFSFAPEMRHIVETSLPSKVAEYLASGVPILVHAPAYATVSRYCRQHNFGLIVDEPDERKLLGGLVRLATDKKLRQELGARALAAAQKYHDRRRIAEGVFKRMASCR